MCKTEEQILTLAPDAATANRGRTLGTASRWRELGGNARLIWGECKGSGNRYYQSQINLTTSSYRCSCPSRKFPCKHIIGLWLILLNDSEAFRITDDLPLWVQQWLEGNADEKAPMTSDTGQKAQARARNRDKRLTRMGEGLKDLESWLLDLLRQGLAATELQPFQFWQEIAARMTDMQLRGISRRLRALPLLKGGQLEWPQRMLAQLAEIYLVVRGFERLEDLPQPLQQELLSIAGINTRKDDLLMQGGVKDDWAVIGLIEGVEENLNMRRVWLYGLKTQQKALILDFVHNSMNFEEQWRNGQLYQGELIYYPSSYPLRALVKGRFEHPHLIAEVEGYTSIAAFREDYAAALMANPWLLDFPCVLKSVVPANGPEGLCLVDQAQHYLSLQSSTNNSGWQLMALSGGQPIDVFGEWTGHDFFPLSVLVDRRFVPLSGA